MIVWITHVKVGHRQTPHSKALMHSIRALFIRESKAQHTNHKARQEQRHAHYVLKILCQTITSEILTQIVKYQ